MAKKHLENNNSIPTGIGLSFARENAVPLDESEVFASFDEAHEYAMNGATAYVGQKLSVYAGPEENPTVEVYVIENTDGDLKNISGSGDGIVAGGRELTYTSENLVDYAGQKAIQLSAGIMVLSVLGEKEDGQAEEIEYAYEEVYNKDGDEDADYLYILLGKTAQYEKYIVRYIGGTVNVGSNGSGATINDDGGFATPTLIPDKANTATAEGAVAMGVCSYASGKCSVAMGEGCQAKALSAIALGNYTEAHEGGAVAIGTGYVSKDSTGKSTQTETKAYGGSSIAMGSGCQTVGKYSVAMGRTSSTTKEAYGGVALGVNNVVGGNSSFAVGEGCKAEGDRSIAMGQEATATGDNSIAMGYNTLAECQGGIAIGTSYGLGDDERKTRALKGYNGDGNNIAIGAGCLSDGHYSLAIGVDTSSKGYASVALGKSNKATHDYSFVMGHNLKTTAPHQIIFGKNNDDRGWVTQNNVFTIGWGKSVNEHEDLFVVKDDGSVFAKGHQLLIAESSTITDIQTSIDNLTKASGKNSGDFNNPGEYNNITNGYVDIDMVQSGDSGTSYTIRIAWGVTEMKATSHAVDFGCNFEYAPTVTTGRERTGSSAGNEGMSISNISTTGFTCKISKAAATNCHWIAIGLRPQ